MKDCSEMSKAEQDAYFKEGLGDNPEKVIIPYRLGTVKEKYIQRAEATILEKLKSTSALRVSLVFVKGIPTDYAQQVHDLVIERLQENGLAGCEKGFVDVHLYTDVSIDAIRMAEGKRI